MLRIGSYHLSSPILLAPMAGVTDVPFRRLCRRFGAGLSTSEMVTSDSRLWNTAKSHYRLQSSKDEYPRSIQIAGSEPSMLADAAQLAVEKGAHIVDINMGCPAKKVCNKAAGSALLRDEILVQNLLETVVAAVDVPVTLKIRTGWSREERNAVRIAQIAEAAGIQLLVVHGRTRADAYRGEAEYDTIKKVKRALQIPVIANGDIDSVEKAAQVLAYTEADGIMIGRASRGQPWLFRDIAHYLKSGEYLPEPDTARIKALVFEHIKAMHQFYPEVSAVRIARKHIQSWLARFSGEQHLRKRIMQAESAARQLEALHVFFRHFDDEKLKKNLMG